MPKLKKPLKSLNLSLDQYLNQYESKTLDGALESLVGSIAWDLFSAYLRARQREMEIAALDLACQDGNSLRAAKASGIACALEEVADKLIPELHNLLQGRTGVVEDTRPD